MNYLLLDMATVMVDFDMKSSFHSSCLSDFDWLSEQGWNTVTGKCTR